MKVKKMFLRVWRLYRVLVALYRLARQILFDVL